MLKKEKTTTNNSYAGLPGHKQTQGQPQANLGYETIIDSISDIVSIQDKDFKLIKVNKAYADAFKMKPKELVGKTCYQIVHQSKKPIVDCPHMKVLTTKKPVVVEIFEPHLGVYLEISASPVFNKEGEVVATIHIAKDITERKRAEEASGESEKRYRTLFESAAEGILIADIEAKKLKYANPAICTMLGYSQEEFTKMSVGDIHPKTSLEHVLAEFDAQARGEKILSSLPCLKKDGTIIYADIKAAKAIINGRECNVGFFTDVTERKRMEQEIKDKNERLEAQNEELRATEEELRASNEELQATNEELKGAQEKLIRSEKLAAIGQLAGGVGHELRNPLGAIKNAIYYIKGKVTKSELAQKEPRVVEFLDIMDDEINSSNKIINDLLGFSRVGKPAVSPTRVEKLIEDAISHTRIPENIELIKKLDASLPEIEIDTDQIRQVMVNIITNGIQAMPEGGKLTIEAKRKDDFLELKISDTGVGIPDNVIGKIFDPLFTTRAKGIGLGLAVCKSIVDRHDGHIDVESSVGKGATFTIKLPLKGGK